MLVVFAAHVGERNGNRQVVACQRLGKNPRFEAVIQSSSTL
jgi:hypothetical protein